MSVNLRDYQIDFKNKVYQAWNSGYRNVLGVMPTGAGKSLTTASIIHDFAQPTCLNVHRRELVIQLSESLATVGIQHRIIAPKKTIQLCVGRQVRKFGRSFYHPQSPVGLASGKTLLTRANDLKQWLSTVRLWVQDETHHLTRDNEFGQQISLMPEGAYGLGVTATPERTDRKGLGAETAGFFHTMVEGPTPAWLISEGYLSNYRYIAPPPSIEMDDDDISPNTGDYKPDAIRRKSHESKIIGDMVKTYLEFAAGLQAIAFVVDIETANDVANAFNAAGVSAAAVSSKTPDDVRSALMDKFTERKIQILVNVDLFDEGLDVPGVECVIMGRPTFSLGKFRQQAGRMIRPVYASGYDLSTREGRLAAIAAGPKPRGVIIDHVNNWKVHKMPDTHRVWTLNPVAGGRKSRKADDEIPLTSCEECFQPYERIHKACPYCGHVKEPTSRSAPEQVDGDLIEFSPELIARLRGEISRVDGSPQIPHGASPVVEASIKKRWQERQEAQQRLRDSIALWAGLWKSRGSSDSESYRRFFHQFGMDVMSAMTLGRSEADELTRRVQEATV